MEDIKNMMGTFLVTGGAGFIGSHLCQALLGEGCTVISADNFNNFYNPRLKLENIKNIERTADALSENGCAFVSKEADIRDAEGMNRIFKDHAPDTVVHIAAYAGVRPSIEQPALYYDVNVNGTVNLLECMKRHGVKRMVFASSSSVYGNNSKIPFSESDPVDNPISPYAATKKAGELLCHVYHGLFEMSIACLRFFTVYGPRQRPDLAIRKMSELILADREVPFYGDGTSERDYTYIDDIVSGILGAVKWVEAEQSRYGIFNLGESRTISLADMVASIEKVLGKKAKIRRLPDQPGDVRRTCADISKSRQELGYNPQTDFNKGINEFINWLTPGTAV